MRTGNERIDQLISHAEEYLNTQKQLSKLMLTEKAGQLFSSVVAAFILFTIFFFSLVFASLALAWGVSECFGSMYAGFIAVTLLYLLAGIVLKLRYERWLKMPLQNIFIRHTLKNKSDDQNSKP